MSSLTKSMARSQKSLLSSSCSNTSLVCDAFNRKHDSTHEGSNTRSSNHVLRYTNTDHSTERYRESQPFIRSSANEHENPERDNNDSYEPTKPSVHEHDNIARDNITDDDSPNMISHSKFQSSGFGAAFPNRLKSIF